MNQAGWIFFGGVGNFLHGGGKAPTSSDIYRDSPEKSGLQTMICMLVETFRQLAFSHILM